MNLLHRNTSTRLMLSFLFVVVLFSIMPDSVLAQKTISYYSPLTLYDANSNPTSTDLSVWSFYPQSPGKPYWGITMGEALAANNIDGLYCAGSNYPNWPYLEGVLNYVGGMNALARFVTFYALQQSYSSGDILHASGFQVSFDCLIPSISTGDSLKVYWEDANNQVHNIAVFTTASLAGWQTFSFALSGFNSFNDIYFNFVSQHGNAGPCAGAWIRNFNLTATVAPPTEQLYFDSPPQYNATLTITPADLQNDPTQVPSGSYRSYSVGTVLQLFAPAVISATGQTFEYWLLNGTDFLSSSTSTTYQVIAESDHISAQYSKIPITITSAGTDKAQYDLAEQPLLSVQLANGFSNANVTYSINGMSPVACISNGNGLFHATLPAQTVVGTYTVTVNAVGSDAYQPAATQFSYTVNNELAGHDMQVNLFTTTTPNVVPGNTIMLDGFAKNLGTYSSQVTVRFRLYDPSNNVVDSISYNTTFNPNGIVEYTPALATQSSWSGSYTAEMYVIYLYDDDPSDNISRLSIYVGNDPPFTQFIMGNSVTIIPQGSTSTVDGYSIYYISSGHNSNGDYANVQVNGGSTTQCYYNQLTSFNGGNFLLDYQDNIGSQALFNTFIPSNYFTPSNYTLAVDAGQTADYNLTCPSSGGFSQNVNDYGPDGTIISGWATTVQPEPPPQQNSFLYPIPIPVNAPRRLYEFWPSIYCPDGNYHIQILKLQVHEPHNVSATSLSPSGGTNITIGDVQQITGTISNPGGYNEPAVNATLTISGPNNYSYSTNFLLNIPMGVTDTVTYSWNTLGLSPGSYNVQIAGIISIDAYPNDNIINASVNLINPPSPSPPVLNYPTDSSTGIQTQFIATWNPVPGASNYRLQVATDSAFSNITFDTTVTINQCRISNLVKGSIYFWQVYAGSFVGFGTPTAPNYFQTVLNPPLVGALVMPEKGVTNESVPTVFSWAAFVGAQRYSLEVAIDTLFSKLLYESDTLVTLSDTVATLMYDTTLYWKVRGINNGGFGDWTAPWKFNTTLGPLLLLGPGNGATGISINATFRWMPVHGATSYSIQIASDSGFSNIVKDSIASLGINQMVIRLDSNVEYYWRFAASNSTMGSIWSVDWSFMTGSLPPPPTPLLVSPVDTTGVPRRANLTWHSFAQTGEYDIQIALDSTFSAIVFDTTTADKNLKLSDTLEARTEYYWRVNLTDSMGTSNYSAIGHFETGTGIDVVKQAPVVPKEFKLYQNYPNPFNPSTIVSYDVPKTSHVIITLYDVLGRKLATIINGTKDPGSYHATFNGSDLPSGVYFYRLQAGSFTQVKKMVLLK